MKQRIDLLQRALDLLALKALTLEPLHGLRGSHRIEQITSCLTKTGKQQLESETEDWQRISLAIATALKAT